MPIDWPLPGQDPASIRILVVDDQELVRVGLLRVLRRQGFTCLEAPDAFRGMEILDREHVDLLLSDIKMPGMSGLTLVKALAHRIPDIAVVMVTSVESTDTAMECLRHGAYGYVLKPFKTADILIAVANALRRRMLELDYRDRQELLATRVRQQTLEIRSSREEIAYRLISASEHRDNETGAHVRRIGLYCAEMALLLGWGPDEIDCIHAAAPMHDIGKIGVPDRILQKEGPLTEEEWIIMKTHPLMGANILRDSQVPFIQMGARIAACHHERWNGEGYPRNLSGETIPIEARITGLVDVFDALSCHRVYKQPWTQDKVFEYIREQRGAHFDPALVDLFLSHRERFSTILTANPDRFVPMELPYL